MPQKYAIKEMVPASYYHVFARGSSKQKVFLDASDYQYFLKLLERYLSSKTIFSKTGQSYPNFRESLELLAYCLMSNHFHLLIFQSERDSLEKFMRSLMTSYSRYFNLKYKRSGAVFESRYKARRIDQQNYLEHISRYIHMNPRYWKGYRNSSLVYYQGKKAPEWLMTEKITGLFAGSAEYMSFLEDYEDVKVIMDELKHQLADQ